MGGIPSLNSEFHKFLIQKVAKDDSIILTPPQPYPIWLKIPQNKKTENSASIGWGEGQGSIYVKKLLTKK